MFFFYAIMFVGKKSFITWDTTFEYEYDDITFVQWNLHLVWLIVVWPQGWSLLFLEQGMVGVMSFHSQEIMVQLFTGMKI